MNKKLDVLLEKNLITKYTIETIEEDPGSGMRESEELSLTFSDGTVLVVGSFCSGSSENTTLFFEVETQGKTN